MATQTAQGKSNEMFGPLNFDHDSLVTDSETKCLLCETSFNLNTSMRQFLMHIFEAHNIVIDEVQEIEELPMYITYWREKLHSTALEEIIPSLSVDCTGHKYFLLSSLLKEDKELRHKLKLEHVLKIQELERADKSFIKPCLFCRLVFEGTRQGYLEHLSTQHNIQLGNPQNLVYIEELVDKIDKKLAELKCIYCEKTFTDRNVLKEHMRKKLHKRINPKSTEYDKYYIVNYLEQDKNWQDIEKEDDRYAIAIGSEPNGDEEYSDWNEQGDLITCLFCQEKELNIYKLCSHMDVEHNFNYTKQTENLDFYQKIKLVNYIRKQVHNNRCVFCDVSCEGFSQLENHFVQENHYKIPELKVFDQPEYYFPTYEDDAFLYLIDNLEILET